MKKSKCPHRYVVHERGRLVPVLVRCMADIPEHGWMEVTKMAKAVVEVCLTCRKKRELVFKEEVG